MKIKIGKGLQKDTCFNDLIKSCDIVVSYDEKLIDDN